MEALYGVGHAVREYVGDGLRDTSPNDDGEMESLDGNDVGEMESMENEDVQEVGGKTKVDVQDSATGESADKLREDSLANDGKTQAGTVCRSMHVHKLCTHNVMFATFFQIRVKADKKYLWSAKKMADPLQQKEECAVILHG